MRRSTVGSLLADRRRNATVAWVLVAFLVAVLVGTAVGGDLLWAGFVGGMLALALVPPVAHRNVTMMLPWEVLAMAALPVIGRSLAGTLEVSALTGNLSMYLSVAALALVVAVELHAFTPVRMTRGFAVFFVVVTTVAAAGVWALARWAVEVTLGVPALYPGLGEEATLLAVNWEFVYSTVAGFVAGGIFVLYFRRFADLTDRVPEEAREPV